MKTLIAIPCMDTVQTLFFSSMLKLRKPEGTETAVISHSLIYDARNNLAKYAVQNGFDRILWLDSDMVFGPDLLERLSADLDEGRELVSGLYFTRKAPVVPCVYKCLKNTAADGREIPWVVPYKDYPEDDVFRIAGCGFGAVMMTVGLLRRVKDAFGQPFWPQYGFGEDFSFCLRAEKAGAALWCDSRIRVGHAGVSIINEDTWKGAQTHGEH